MQNMMGGFMPFPLPWGGVTAAAPVSEVLTPARVGQAMEFLQMLNTKQAQRGAVGDSATLELDGLPLSRGEESARDAACQMLTDYFNGKLDMDPWEKLRYDAAEREARAATGDSAVGPGGNLPGVVMRCQHCQPGNPSPACLLCQGTGQTITWPMPASFPPKGHGQPPGGEGSRGKQGRNREACNCAGCRNRRWMEAQAAAQEAAQEEGEEQDG